MNTYVSGRLESQAGIASVPRLGLAEAALLVEEDGILLLERSLGLRGVTNPVNPRRGSRTS